MLICNVKPVIKLSLFDKFSLTPRISDSKLSFFQFDKSETLAAITFCYERSLKGTNELLRKTRRFRQKIILKTLNSRTSFYEKC